MKYIKEFENNKELENGLYNFYDKYYKNKDHKDLNKEFNILHNVYEIPEVLKDDLNILIFMYDKNYYWQTSIKEINNYIKRKVKEKVIDSILNRIENSPEIYEEIKTCLDSRPKFNDSGSFQYIRNSIARYTFFLLHSVDRRVPEYIKNVNKYNL